MFEGSKHLSYEERERHGFVQPGQPKALGDLSKGHRYLTLRVKKAEPDSSPWGSVTGQDVTDTT